MLKTYSFLVRLGEDEESGKIKKLFETSKTLQGAIRKLYQNHTDLVTIIRILN